MSVPSSAAHRSGLALIALAAMSWGTTGSVTAILVARAEATPLVIGAVRVLVAAAALLVATRGLGGLRGGGCALGWRCVAMGVAMAAYQATYFTAVTLGGITVTALIAICSAPLLIAALAAAFLGERLDARAGTALALGVLGAGLLVADPGVEASAARSVAGAGLALAAGLAYALYVVLAKAALARAAPLPLAAATFTVAALVLLPALATPGVTGQLVAGWPWLLYLGLVATAGSYAVYTWALRAVSATAAGIVTLAEPLTATALGTLVFDERLGAAGAAGGALLLAAFAVLATGRGAGPGAG